MDLFDKCRVEIVEKATAENVYPYFHQIESKQAPEVIMEGSRRIMLGSNNYLGLTSNPDVIAAGVRALEKYGSGCSGSRFLNGTLDLHVQLESELADSLNKEDVMTFSTGSKAIWASSVRLRVEAITFSAIRRIMQAFMTAAN